MKWLLLICLFFLKTACFAQKHQASFSAIDWRVQSIEPTTPESLAQKLTSPYSSDLEKTRAIFSWISQHISYNTGIYSSRRYSSIKYIPSSADTASIWKSGMEMTAITVLQRRVAVCEGYAKLFKVLCDYAGLRSEVIYGYAKCYLEKTDKFRTNHSWNAVMIDSTWRLLDVTWASGYINGANEFVQRTDESYFLTPPAQFILDHYPEDLRWTLLDHVPALREFLFSPFKYKSFIKYSIFSLSPPNGTIESSIGDTVRISFYVKDAEKNKKICSDPFFDSTQLFSAASAFLSPDSSATKVEYSYVVKDDSVEWLHLLYNDDLVLRYRLKVIREKKNPTSLVVAVQ
ncbi:MAG: transglutaminase domain-containing protein [Flavisolibacter sp.]